MKHLKNKPIRDLVASRPPVRPDRQLRNHQSNVPVRHARPSSFPAYRFSLKQPTSQFRTSL